jgi:PAS domain S-box-containing protein
LGGDEKENRMSTPLRVLIVEDSADDAELVLHALRRGGYAPTCERVATAADLRAALQQPWEVVLSDYKMPGFSGLAALVEVRATDPDVPFILVSGTIGEDMAVQAMKTGANDYVMKDQLARLVPAIQRELKETCRRREHRRATAERDRLFDLSLDMLCIVDFDGHVKQFNPACEKILGWSPAEIVATPYLEFVVPDDRAVFLQKIQELGAGKSISAVELRFLRKDGAVRWISWDAFPVVAEQRIFAVGRDVTEHKQAEAALLRAKEDWERTFDAVPDLISIHDASFRVVRVNKALADKLGVKPEAIMGQVCYAALHGTSCPLAACPHAQLLRDGVSHTSEIHEPRLGGDFLFTCSPIFDAAGKLFGSVHVAHDITARKKVEAALQASEARFRQIFLNMSSGVAVYAAVDDGADFIIKEFNPAAERATQMRRVDVVGRRLMEVFPGVVAFGLLDVFQRVWRTGTPEHQPARFYQDEHLSMWAENYVYKLPSGELVAIFDDITMRKTAEDALLQERNLLYALMDNIPDKVYFKDTELRFTKISRAHATYLGLANPGDIMGRTDREFQTPQRAQETFADEQHILQTGQPLIAKVEQVVQPNGAAHWSSISKVPIKDTEGRITGLVGISRDITHEMELQQQIQQAAKMDAIGRLAGGVAHDFNNLLQAILGFTEILLGGADPQQAQWHDLKEIQKAALRAADLTRQLLAFSRKQAVSPRVLDLNQVVANTEKMLGRLLGEDIELQTQLAPALKRVKADPAQMDQFIMNLAVNARDAMPNGGRLTISTSNVEFAGQDKTVMHEVRRGPFVCLAISDTGIGMSPDVLAHIFEPFFTTKEVGKGTGLGLAVSYGIAKQNNGWINVYSQEGHGTTFKLYLPVYAGADEAVAAEVGADVSAALHGHGERILLVEDEPGVRTLAAQVLQSAGYTLCVCSSAQEALRACAREGGRFDLLFSDVVLPDGNGVELSAKILAQHPGLPVLLCSGYTDERSRWIAIEEKGFHFLQKPYPLAALLDAVRKVLDARPAPPKNV